MPISQATILAIYGDLADLCEKIETAYNLATQPDLFSGPVDREEAVRLQVGNLLAAARDAQQMAITTMLSEEPAMHFNPITGRVDE